MNRELLRLKDEGREAFKVGEYDRAQGLYTEAMRYVNDSAEDGEAISMKVTLLCNRALVYNRCGKHREAEEDASMAIEGMPGHLKAYHHRKVARRALGLNEGADADEKMYQKLRCMGQAVPRPAVVVLGELAPTPPPKQDMSQVLLKYCETEIELASRAPIDAESFPILSSLWWNACRTHLKSPGAFVAPGPIDNSVLLVGTTNEYDDEVATDESMDDRDAFTESSASGVERMSDGRHSENWDMCDDNVDASSTLSTGATDSFSDPDADNESCCRKVVVIPDLLPITALAPFDDGLELKAGLVRDRHFIVVPMDVWEVLKRQFGGGPLIRRPMVPDQSSRKLGRATPELHPMRLNVQLIGQHPDTASTRARFLCGPSQTVRGVLRMLGSLWTTTASDIRAIRNVMRHSRQFEVIPDSAMIESLTIADGGTLFVERRSSAGGWSAYNDPFVEGEKEHCAACCASILPQAQFRCSVASDVIYCSVRCMTNHRSSHEQSCSKDASLSEPAGVKGLLNIGNSCYLNAALQCLSHARELTQTFLSDDYVAELNRVNPLGCKGVLAESYAALLKDIWWGTDKVVDPRTFKTALATFASRFAGTQQQDAQEFLAFLLDGLHEDLNRIHSKPYIETRDSDGRPDDEVAVEGWKNYLARNQSVVVDLALGQLKSELQCPNRACPPRVTFDPFMYASLPLPESRKRVKLLYCPHTGAIPSEIEISVTPNASVGELTRQVEAALSSRSDYSPEDSLSLVKRTTARPLVPLVDGARDAVYEDLAAFQVAPGHVALSCVHLINPPLLPQCSVLFRGQPFMINIPADKAWTGAEMYQRLRAYLSRCLQDPECRAFKLRIVLNGVPINIEDNDVVPDIAAGVSSAAVGPCAHLLMLFWDSQDLINEFDMSEYQRTRESSCMYSSYRYHPEVPITIYDCLRAFTAADSLGNDDWICGNCKQKGNGSKRLSIWRLPDMLVLHLKRFDSIRRHFFFGETPNKIGKHVDFPLRDLNLGDFVSSNGNSNLPPPIFELFAVINHYGASFFGHYSAFAKGLDNRWRHFDDDTVREIDESQVCQENAYVLFYRRQQANQ